MTAAAQFTLNLRISKTFGFGGPATNGGAASEGGGGPRGGGGRGGRGGFGGPFGNGGGPTRSASETAQKYNLTLAAQIRNVFNTVNLATPIGNLSSPLFGESIALAGGPFSSQAANRSVSLQLSFRF